eukprot:254620_1
MRHADPRHQLRRADSRQSDPRRSDAHQTIPRHGDNPRPSFYPEQTDTIPDSMATPRHPQWAATPGPGIHDMPPSPPDPGIHARRPPSHSRSPSPPLQIPSPFRQPSRSPQFEPKSTSDAPLDCPSPFRYKPSHHPPQPQPRHNQWKRVYDSDSDVNARKRARHSSTEQAHGSRDPEQASGSRDPEQAHGSRDTEMAYGSKDSSPKMEGPGPVVGPCESDTNEPIPDVAQLVDTAVREIWSNMSGNVKPHMKTAVQHVTPFSLAKTRVFEISLASGKSPESLTLMDPVSNSRISVPVRGRKCVHNEAFDLSSFLENSLKESKTEDGRCPICGQTIQFYDLSVDPFLLHILADTTADEIFLTQGDRSWHLTRPVEKTTSRPLEKATTSYAERSSPRKSSSRSSFRSSPRYSDRSSSSHRRQSQSSNPLLARRQVGKLEIEKLISAVRDSQRTKHTFAETLMTKIVALCEDSYTHEDFKKIARYSKALERLPAAAIKWMGCCRSPMSVFYNWILALRHILEAEFDSPRQETHDVLARVFKFLLHFDASDMRTEEITVLIEGLNLPYKYAELADKVLLQLADDTKS